MKNPRMTFVALALAACSSTPEGGDSAAAAATADAGAGATVMADGVRSPIMSERTPAPEFVLFDQDSFPFPLAESRGKWVVLHFYPESDTPDCACDATAFTGHLWRFNDLDAEVACITSSPGDRTLLFAKKYGLQSPLLSDVDLQVARQYGAVRGPHVGPEALLTADALVRTTVLLDPALRIAARWDSVKSNEHVESILATLRELRKRDV